MGKVLLSLVGLFLFAEAQADMESYFGIGTRSVEDGDTGLLISVRVKGEPVHNAGLGDQSAVLPRYQAYIIHDLSGDYTEASYASAAFYAQKQGNAYNMRPALEARFTSGYYLKDESLDMEKFIAVYATRFEARGEGWTHDDNFHGAFIFNAELFGIGSTERGDGEDETGLSHSAGAIWEIGSQNVRISVDGKIRYIGKSSVQEFGIGGRVILSDKAQLILRHEMAQYNFDNGDEESETESDRFIVLLEYLPRPADGESFSPSGWDPLSY